MKKLLIFFGLFLFGNSTIAQIPQFFLVSVESLPTTHICSWRPMIGSPDQPGKPFAIAANEEDLKSWQSSTRDTIDVIALTANIEGNVDRYLRKRFPEGVTSYIFDSEIWSISSYIKKYKRKPYFLFKKID